MQHSKSMLRPIIYYVTLALMGLTVYVGYRSFGGKITLLFRDPDAFYRTTQPESLILSVDGFLQSPLLQMLALMVVLYLLMTVYQWTFKTKNNLASAQFARVRDLRRYGFVRNILPAKKTFVLGKQGFSTVFLPDEKFYEHALVVAPAGQGKSTRIIVPALLREDGARSLLVNDVKFELYPLCSGQLSQRMKVSIFAPTRPAISVHYNPLDHVHSMEDAEDLARCWVENTGMSRETYYNDTARLLITAVVLHLRDQEPGAPFSRLADLLGSSTVDQIKKLLTGSKSSLARAVGASFINNAAVDPKLAAGILSGMAARFMMVRNPTITDLTSTHPDAAKNIDFNQLIEEPGALFVAIAPKDKDRLKPISACLIMQAIHCLQGTDNRKRPFAFYLDELANTGRIPNYAEHVTTLRSSGVAFIQALQDIAQLRRVYGDEAPNILASTNTKIFLPALSKADSEYASELLGESTITAASESSRDYSQNKSRSWSPTRRHLMTPDEIRQMKHGELLVVSSNLKAMKLKNKPYYKQWRLRRRAKLPLKKPETPSSGTP